MSALFLDQSLSSTGHALLTAGGEVISGAWPLCEGVRNRRQGFRELFQKMDAIHKEHRLDVIVHEEPLLISKRDGVQKLIGLYGLVAIIELFAASRSVEVVSYPAKSWRGTFFTKEERAAMRGDDWKRPAIERCRQLGFDPITDDEAEAIAIMDHHLHKMRAMPTWRADHPFLETVA